MKDNLPIDAYERAYTVAQAVGDEQRLEIPFKNTSTRQATNHLKKKAPPHMYRWCACYLGPCFAVSTALLASGTTFYGYMAVKQHLM